MVFGLIKFLLCFYNCRMLKHFLLFVMDPNKFGVWRPQELYRINDSPNMKADLQQADLICGFCWLVLMSESVDAGSGIFRQVGSSNFVSHLTEYVWPRILYLETRGFPSEQ